MATSVSAGSDLDLAVEVDSSWVTVFDSGDNGQGVLADGPAEGAVGLATTGSYSSPVVCDSFSYGYDPSGGGSVEQTAATDTFDADSLTVSPVYDAAGTLTFDPGITTQNVSITIVDDAEVEADETVEVTLSNAVSATLGSNTVHSYTILDNDGVSPPGQASNPSPADGATKVARSGTILSWTAGAGAESHDVYFGTNPNPGPSEFQLNQTDTTFTPGYLDKKTWYYWRIDEVNAGGTTTGVVWIFRSGSK